MNRPKKKRAKDKELEREIEMTARCFMEVTEECLCAVELDSYCENFEVEMSDEPWRWDLEAVFIGGRKIRCEGVEIEKVPAMVLSAAYEAMRDHMIEKGSSGGRN